jgi:DtxR family Mn-dependent transcriptional regulator
VAKPALTEAIQDYLRAIYKVGEGGGSVSVTALAKRLSVSPASASAMVKKLAALGLAAHQPYRGIELTAAGERVALEVIRHHRLLELYLAETLGVDVNEVHDEAERLEHVLSEELEERIDKALGFPTHDPHGDPIPDANLEWPAAQRPVRDSGPGEEARGNREVSPATTRTDRKTSAPKASAARRG